MRRYHWLKPNWETKLPEHHICVATVCRPLRGDPGQLVLAAWALRRFRFEAGEWFTESTHSGAAAATFWPMLRDLLPGKGKAWVWFLCPRLDLPALHFAWQLERGTFERVYWVWQDPPVIIDGTFHGRAVRFNALANWLPGDVEDITRMIHNDACVASRAASVSRIPQTIAELDAQVTAEAVGRILRTVYREDLGHLRNTVGGQAFQAYRHLHLPGKVLSHGCADALRLERGAAWGWPPDLIRQGEVNERVTVLDVNALFPHVMRHYPYPRYLLWHSDNGTVEDLKRASETALLIARVKIVDCSRSYLVQEDGKCRMKRGTFNGVLVGEELMQAVNRGAVAHVWEAAGYEGAGLFCQWADWVWALRQRCLREGDRIGGHIAKQIAVALWGQFGQRLERYVPCGGIQPPQPYAVWWHHPVGQVKADKCRSIAGLVDKLEDREEPKDSIPAITAFVASYARVYMANLRAVAGEGNTVYQCADSLHVTDDGLAALQRFGIIDPGRLGALKIVSQARKTCYLAPNTYVMDGTLTAAGIYGKAEMVRPGEWRWRLPRRLTETMFAAPTGLIAAPEVSKVVPGLESKAAPA